MTLITLLLSITVLPSILAALFALKLIFEKNVLRVKEAYLIPMALCLFVALNWAGIKCFLEWLMPPACVTADCLVDSLRFKLTQSIWSMGTLVAYMIGFTILPFLASLWIAIRLRSAWDLPEDKRNWLHHWMARFVAEHVLNYMGQLTASVTNEEVVMMDVQVAGGVLYSGLFKSYYLNDGNLVGITITKALKFTPGASSAERSNYIIPNQGDMFFPMEKVENIHLWKIRKDMVIETTLSSELRAVRTAWLTGILHGLSGRLPFKIKILADGFTENAGNEYYKSFRVLRMGNDAVNMEEVGDDLLVSQATENSASKS